MPFSVLRREPVVVLNHPSIADAQAPRRSFAAMTLTGSGTPLQAKGIEPCIPGRKSRTEPIKYDKRRYKRRSRIEIMFGRLKDWRRVATRYDRCPTVFFSAVALAATVILWLWSTSPDPR
jgi:transposase